jgi:hypothetical protein
MRSRRRRAVSTASIDARLRRAAALLERVERDSARLVREEERRLRQLDRLIAKIARLSPRPAVRRVRRPRSRATRRR